MGCVQIEYKTTGFMIQQQEQTDPIKFEVHMYHPTAMANAVTPTSWQLVGVTAFAIAVG